MSSSGSDVSVSFVVANHIHQGSIEKKRQTGFKPLEKNSSWEARLLGFVHCP